jgi:hypothetical protein
VTLTEGKRDVATALCGRFRQRLDIAKVATIAQRHLTTGWPPAIRERIGAHRDDGAPADVALRFVEVFAVVRR